MPRHWITPVFTGTFAAGYCVLSALAAPAAKPVVKSPAKAAPVEAAAEFFESRVRPVLAANCYKCHGPAKQLGSLRLDSREAMVKGGDRGPALVPGKPDASLVIQAIRHRDPAPAMPPSKSLKPDEVEALTRWVAQGAPWPEYSGTSPAAVLWSLQPVKKPALPVVRNAAWVRNPIDAFVLAKLEEKGLAPAPEADPRTLIRRAYYDLTGLPPTPAEVEAFARECEEETKNGRVEERKKGGISAKRSSPPPPIHSSIHSPAYERLIDRLLASPRYGERWARYWLDLVRYADSNGYERDGEKPNSWKYRDYVIKAFNEDRPYNRFVQEQLAGDELPNRTEDTVAATGFLRLGTWDDEPNDPLEYKYERLDDLVHATGTAFLGLTVKCARCHDHKFDPIPQQDYYAFAASFYGGYLEPGDGRLLGGPPPERLGFPVLGFTDHGREAPPLRRLKNGDPRKEEEEVPPAFLRAIGPLGHRYETAADAATTQRRLHLAEWITDPRNPLTSRVLVNRMWQYHFGEGIVRSPNNFGRTGTPPTHPELLDWLAARFAGVESPESRVPSRTSPDPGPGTRDSGLPQPWSLKSLHRLIMLSSTYRMASLHPQQADYEQKDASNLFLWRQNRRRLDADALRDSMLAVSGELNLTMGGRGFMPTVNQEALEGLSRKGAEWTPSPIEEQRRRTVYMFLKRAMVMPLLTAFDFSDTTQPVGQRDVTIVPTQALTLLNNQFVHGRAEALAGRVAEAGANPDRAVALAWETVLGRAPSAAERAAARRHFETLLAVLEKEDAAAPTQAGLPENPALWLRADQGVETDADGRVLRWADQASRKLDAVPPTPEARPLVVKDAVSGRPALRFDGKGRFLALPAGVLTSQQFTVIAVANDRDGGGQHREIFSNWNAPGNIGTAFFLGLTGGSTIRLSDHFVPAGNVQDREKHFVLTAVSDRAGAAVYQGRKEIARRSGPLPPRNLDGPYVVGQQGNIRGEYWNGDIAELLVYDRALSDGELQRVWDWTARRYRLAAPLPARVRALASLCRVLLNTNEFCFVD